MGKDKVYRNFIVEQLTDLSSEEYQRHEWIEDPKHSWYFPDEIMCRWFDDASLGERDISLVDLTPEELVILQPISIVLKKFYEQYKITMLPEELLHFPSWVAVRETAQQTLRKLEKAGWNTKGHYLPGYTGFIVDDVI